MDNIVPILTKFLLFGWTKENTHNRNPVTKNKVVGLGVWNGTAPKNIL